MKGLVLTQTTDYPKNGKVSLKFDAAPAAAVALNVRCPGWAVGNVVFMLNGKVVAEGKPGTCAKLEAPWKKGDVLTLDIPMGLRYEPLLGGHEEYVAFFHGPILLAGDFGVVIASQKLEHNQPGKFFDVEYPLPAELLAGKETITVRLDSKKRTLVGGLFGCAVLKSAKQ